jgi:uncharacterized protein (TIGR02147 family)
MPTISIYDYTEYPKYLRDYYDIRKETDNWFSYQYMADKLKLSNKSQIARIFEGKRKRLPNEIIEGFNQILKHTPEEAGYFLLLVALFEAESAEEKNSVLRMMNRSLRQQQIRELERKEYEYMREWYHPIVREVITTPGFTGGAKEIAQLMLTRIPLEQIEESIDLLRNLGMIAKDGEQWNLKDVSVSLKQDRRKLAVRHYQKQLLSMLPEALGVDKDKYRTRTITATFGFDVNQIDEILAIIEDFYKKLLGLLTDMDATKNQVYQFNLQLYPLTKRIVSPNDG